jgi:hypothetical protein
MERHEDKTPARETAEAAAERLEHEHPARPEQTGDDDSFAEGVDRKPDTPEEEMEPNFARGISREPIPGTERHGRFSEGIEEQPDTPEKEVERRFSEGVERSPTSE